MKGELCRQMQDPCQGFARNCATRNHAPPHDPILDSFSHLPGCVCR
jgi:hypothetical protein